MCTYSNSCEAVTAASTHFQRPRPAAVSSISLPVGLHARVPPPAKQLSSAVSVAGPLQRDYYDIEAKDKHTMDLRGSGSIRTGQIHLARQTFAAVKPAVIYPFHFLFLSYFESEVSRAPGGRKQSRTSAVFYLRASKHEEDGARWREWRRGRGCAVNPNLNKSRGDQRENNKEWMAASS